MKITIPIDRGEDTPDLVIRGGSWSSFPNNMRASNRINVSPANRNYIFGFRIVRNQK